MMIMMMMMMMTMMLMMMMMMMMMIIIVAILLLQDAQQFFHIQSLFFMHSPLPAQSVHFKMLETSFLHSLLPVEINEKTLMTMLF